MTWIKPSFAWMLYRSGYGLKHGSNAGEGAANGEETNGEANIRVYTNEENKEVGNGATNRGCSQDRILKLKISHASFGAILN